MLTRARRRAAEASYFQDYAVSYYARLAGCSEQQAIRRGRHAERVVFWVTFLCGDGRFGRLLLRIIP